MHLGIACAEKAVHQTHPSNYGKRTHFWATIGGVFEFGLPLVHRYDVIGLQVRPSKDAVPEFRNSLIHFAGSFNEFFPLNLSTVFIFNNKIFIYCLLKLIPIYTEINNQKSSKRKHNTSMEYLKLIFAKY